MVQYRLHCFVCIFAAEDANALVVPSSHLSPVHLVSFYYYCLSSLYLLYIFCQSYVQTIPLAELSLYFFRAGDLASRVKTGQQTLERKQIKYVLPDYILCLTDPV